MLDELRAERLRDHVSGSGERVVDVAALHTGDREHVSALVQLRRPCRQRLERVGHGLEHFVLDVHERGRCAGGMARFARYRGDDVADVGRGLAFAHELAPVPGDRSLCPFAGDVVGGDDRHHSRLGQCPGRVDADDPGARMIREPEGAVEHARHNHVAHEHVVAEGHLRALVAGGPRPDPTAAVGHGERLTAAGGSCELDRVQDLDVTGAATQVAE